MTGFFVVYSRLSNFLAIRRLDMYILSIFGGISKPIMHDMFLESGMMQILILFLDYMYRKSRQVNFGEG
jgi:hypothetical protein